MKYTNYLIILLLFVSCEQAKKSNTAFDNFGNLNLPAYSKNKLLQDFDLLTKSLKEAHTGLYWYSTEKEFDHLVAIQRGKIKDSLNGLQFYNLVSPIVAFTKEDHCDIHISEEIKNHLELQGLFLPFYVKNLGQKTFIVNNLVINGINLKGFQITSIDGLAIENIKSRIYNTFASDGYIKSSKIVFLDDDRFSTQYARVIDQRKTSQITVVNPVNGQEKKVNINSVDFKKLKQIANNTINEYRFLKPDESPARLKIIDPKIALIKFNTFSNSAYKKAGMNFKDFVDGAFANINKNNIQNLIIDVRENGGGTEGNEDYLFSYLTDKPYHKYKEVELSNFEFSFIAYTDFADEADRKELYEELRNENQRQATGKIARKPNLYVPESLKENPFLGNIYVLTSGWTYSGGAEFCSLMKEHTAAIFIGQEVGGGYYGNTSGTVLELTLPATKLKIDLPILKFNLDVNKGTFGRGVIPNYEIVPTFEAYINGKDKETEKAMKLILK